MITDCGRNVTSEQFVTHYPAPLLPAGLSCLIFEFKLLTTLSTTYQQVTLEVPTRIEKQKIISTVSTIYPGTYEEVPTR